VVKSPQTSRNKADRTVFQTRFDWDSKDTVFSVHHLTWHGLTKQ